MAVNSLKSVAQKKEPERPKRQPLAVWARAVWKAVFSEGLKTTQVTIDQLPKALHSLQSPRIQVATREGWVQQKDELPVKFEKGTFEGKPFYLVSIGGETMLYDTHGKDLLGLMNPEPGPEPVSTGWRAP